MTSNVDGNLGYDEVTPETPKTYTGQQSVKLRYYRGFADKVQISVNGKQVAPPPAPAKGNIEFEITKENLARIFESGQIVQGESQPATPETTPQTTPVTAAATPVQSTANAATATPRPGATSPRPAFTPASTPRRTPTPIVVGRPPAPQPSPN